MQRVIILHTLLWLGANNILYNNVVINYEKMANEEDKLVSRSVKENTILSPSDYFKYKGYTYNISKDNLENDLHATISDSNELQSGLHIGCVWDTP